MAYGEAILVQLCGLEGTDFEVRDVKISEDLIEWEIHHKEPASYICPRCEARQDFMSLWFKSSR